MSNQDAKRWPKSFTTEKYGTFVSAQQDYEMWDRLWNCTYVRKEDGKRYTFSASAMRSDFDSDLDRILQSNYKGLFAPSDEIKGGGE